MGSFLNPAAETLGSAAGRAVPSSQAREPGAVICVSVHGGGWMQFVKDPPRSQARAGLVELQEPRGTHPPQPGCPQNGSSRLPTPQNREWGHLCCHQLPCSPWHHCHPPRARGAGWDHPIRHGVSSALPSVTQGSSGGVFGPTWRSPAVPPLHRGDSAGVTVRGRTLCWGHCHTRTGGTVAGLQSWPHCHTCTGVCCARVSTTPVQGDTAAVTVTPAWGEH